MTRKKPRAPSTAPVLALDPFEVLDAAHAQALTELDKLEDLVARLKSHGVDAQARALAIEVVEFFDTYGREHHVDEEKHVFPCLLTQGDDDTVRAVRSLLLDHRWLHEDWREVGAQIDAVANGQGWVDLDRLSEGAQVFIGLQRAHVAFEESFVYPQARLSLEQRQRIEMGREIAARHRIARRKHDGLAMLEPEQIESLRNGLRVRESRLKELVRQAAANADEEAGACEDRDVIDQKDLAARDASLVPAQGREDLERAELAAIEAALRRIDQGRYGRCVDCAEPIPVDRLLAQPECLRCATCQGRFEARHKLDARH
ncbi:MAG: hemerythrin domain-containing protein [Paucibacter sp.]|nr:hemerythrin domain-containing protein [Roseateles sp.]